MAASKSNYVMVAAIDFGTTYSGYGFSFTTAKEDIKLNKNWGVLHGFQSYKTPTTVLTNSKGEFVAFGYEAEDQFTTPDDEDDDEKEAKDNGQNLYRNFKMILHKNEKLTLNSVVCSTTGQITPAIDIFTYALSYLKEHLLEEISKQLASPPDPSMIQWVITVPAIWSEEAKQFMREAAYRSGCIPNKDSKQLIVALEPEAASFFCRELDLAHFDNSKKISFPSGTKYLVLDCGGGTNDMVVHEVVIDYKVKELCAVNGGSAGGTKVDENFILFLEDILGWQFIQAFRDEHPKEWFTFISAFEKAKKGVKPDGKSKISVPMPYSMPAKYSIMKPGKKLEKDIKSMKERGISFSNGAFIFSNAAVAAIFDEVIASIVKGVQEVLQSIDIHSLDYVLMVGGFCENLFLQDAIRNKFGTNGCQILVPAEAQLAIIKGAVLFAHYQNQMISRIARHTYGCRVRQEFNAKFHDVSKKFTDTDNEVLCDHVFDILVEYGDEIELGAVVNAVHRLRVDQKSVIFELYSLKRKPNRPVEYTDSPDMNRLGKIELNTSDAVGEKGRKVKLQLTFGATEMLVEAIDMQTNKRVATTIHFLS